MCALPWGARLTLIVARVVNRVINRGKLMRRTSACLCALLAGAGLASSLVAAAPATAKTTGPGDITTVAGGPGRGPALSVAQDVGSVAAGPRATSTSATAGAWCAR